MKESIKVKIKKSLKENEIELVRRTKANYTHEVLEDHNIQEITLWKIPQNKIIRYYIGNIFSFGITYIIAKKNPKYFIKFCCLPCSIKEVDYFLVKDIYDTYKICPKETKRIVQSQNGLNDDLSLESVLNTNNTNNQIIGFGYNTKFYEYNETMNKIVPNYFNLSLLSNKRIYQLFIEGHTTQIRAKKFLERYGKNICKFDYRLLNYYFMKAELFLLIMGIALAGIEMYCGSQAYFYFLTAFIIIIFIYQYISNRNFSLECDETLEPANKQLKVKRRYMSQQENKDYCYINFVDLIPGDLIYLTKGDEVPCDGIILEGECLIGNSMVNGSINEMFKKALDNNSFNFDYEINNPSILFHGSKIIKTYSKLENNSILLLAINTGSNTYKANQLSNIRYLFKRNKSYNEIYSKFCGKKNTLFFHGLSLFLLGSAISLIIFFLKYKEGFNMRIIDLILNILSRSFFPSFHVVSSGIIFIGAIYLANDNIKCFDKSRLLYAGGVNTIFFDKTGTLSEKNLEIGGFFPMTLAQNNYELNMKFYNINQIKDLNGNLIDYYTEYQKNEENLEGKCESDELIQERNIKMFPKKLMVLFLECMASCNTLEKKNNQIAGNEIEKEIFTHIKWEIKPNYAKEEAKDFLNSNNKLKKVEEKEMIDEDDNEYKNLERKTINSKPDIIYEDDGKIKINDENINIYPNSYYKITEGKILENKKKSNIAKKLNQNINNPNKLIFTEQIDLSSKEETTPDISEEIPKDKIPKRDLLKPKEKVYFLKIFRRFIKTGTIYSSSLAYNALTDTVNFFIKGPPEEILPFCNQSFLPKDIYRIINYYRKNGFINLILAGKELDSKEDEILMTEDQYKDDLIFYGLIILKNKLKKETKPVIQELKKLNCDLILNTGDNIYNSLAVGYESGIITEKNIFHININKFTQKLMISSFNDFSKSEMIKNDKLTLRNNDKISFLKNKVQNFKPFSVRKISDLLVNKLFQKIKKEDTFENKKNSNNFFSGKESPLGLNPVTPNKTLFKSLRLPLKDINNFKTMQKPVLGFIKESSNESRTKNKTRNNKSDKKLEQKNDGLNSFNQSISINSKNELIDKSINKASIIHNNNDIDIRGSLNNQRNHNSIHIPQEASKQIDSRNLNKVRTSTIFPPSSDYSKNATQSISNKSIHILNKVESPKTTKFPNNFIHFNNQISTEYFPSKLKQMRSECIYCVSGKALRYIYLNRHNPELRKLELPILLNHIKKFGKVFYEMHSKDKSLLIDIFRKMPNKITCMIGDGQNDLDAMMTAHVGINLNKPVNKNTVLCHFHPTDGSLFCIAKIIRYGRVIYENVYLLGVSSFLCALNIVATMVILYYYNIKFVKVELDFMSCNYFILSIIAFTVKPDISLESCLLFHNPSLMKQFFMIISISNVILNAGFTTLFIKFYSKNEELDREKRYNIFGTYIYFMCYIQILGMIYSINSINFYRINHRNNYLYWILMVILIFFVSFIFCIFGYSIHPVLDGILEFEYNPKNVDTFDDKNKLISFCIFIGNIFCFYFFVVIMHFVYNKKAKNEYNKKNNILIGTNKKQD